MTYAPSNPHTPAGYTLSEKDVRRLGELLRRIETLPRFELGDVEPPDSGYRDAPENWVQVSVFAPGPLTYYPGRWFIFDPINGTWTAQAETIYVNFPNGDTPTANKFYRAVMGGAYSDGVSIWNVVASAGGSSGLTGAYKTVGVSLYPTTPNATTSAAISSIIVDNQTGLDADTDNGILKIYGLAAGTTYAGMITPGGQTIGGPKTIHISNGDATVLYGNAITVTKNPLGIAGPDASNEASITISSGQFFEDYDAEYPFLSLRDQCTHSGNSASVLMSLATSGAFTGATPVLMLNGQTTYHGGTQYTFAAYGVNGNVGISGTDAAGTNFSGGIAYGLGTTVTAQVVQGGAAAASHLDLRATAGVGVGSEHLKFTLGNNGAFEFGRITPNGTADGALGIGTTSPARQIDIISNNPAPGLRISGAAATYGPELTLVVPGSGHEWRIGSASGTQGGGATIGCLYVYDATATIMRMIIDTNGVIGNGQVNNGGVPANTFTVVGWWQVADLAGNTYWVPLYQ
jgi:hypothetical protein